MDVVAYFELELVFILTQLLVAILLFTSFYDVACHLVRKTFQNIICLSVVNYKFHITDLVVKCDSLGKWEHAALWEDFVCLYCTSVCKLICDAHWQRVVLFNDEGRY